MKVGDLVTKIVHPNRQLYGLIIEAARVTRDVASIKVAWLDYGTFWQPVAKIKVVQ